MTPNRLKLQDILATLRATVSELSPSDFPVGSLRSRVAARAKLDVYNHFQHLEELAGLENPSPLEEASVEGVENAQVRHLIRCFVRVGLEIDRLFGYKSPTVEEVRHNRRVAKAIDELTDGQAGSYIMHNPAV